ncbi:hypothetical protein RHGRI_038948 [Rhododendron griersonianum]|uniref:Uncharacterized protein n=1 Tax=Rhododendron griersonianum TaxID=479676 RepID=A0AAV6HIR7_9ERIC|nr:hypothetical protein RHGRI_038948 [Rhododendron griersonianum]
MQFHLTEMGQGEDEEALQGLTSTIGTNISEGAYKTDSLFSSACIYRVPKELRKLKESAYTPQLIAIGPLHQKDEHLKTPFQGVKKSYTNNLLLRLTAVKMEGSETKCYEYPKVLQECVKEMKDCVDKARKCYAEELVVSDDHMLEMMLVDGCFILELLYKFDELESKTKEAKITPKEEGQEGKRYGASTSSDLSTPLLQVPSTRLLSTSSDLSTRLLQVEIAKKIAEQSQPGVTNPQSEVQVSIDVLGKRSGYLKGYGICKSTYATQSQVVPNSEDLHSQLKELIPEQQRRLNEGASQIPESSESHALREELFTSVLKPDRNGRVRTYGLGPCPSQVFGTRYTRSQEQRVKDQLRAELRAELGAELLVELCAELRQEVLRDVNDEIIQLKNQYATMAAYMKSAGHPLPPSPNGAGNGDGDHTPSLMEHNGQVDRT